MVQSLSPEANSFWAIQQTPLTLWNMKVHYRIHNSKLHFRILNQFNPDVILTVPRR